MQGPGASPNSAHAHLPSGHRACYARFPRTRDGTAMTVKLAHTAFGTAGPPVVILHGLLGAAQNWATIAKRLAATHRVFALDLRNHGASPWAARMTYHDLAADVLAFMIEHDLAPAQVIGHSMGGKVAMQLALSHGAAVARLLVVDVAPIAYPQNFIRPIEAMQRLDLTALPHRSDVDAALRPAIPDADVRAFLMRNLVRTEAGFAWRPNLAALAANMSDLAAFPANDGRTYQRPTLFITGERSDYVLPTHRSDIERYFPNAGIAAIANANHWVHAEQPAAFLERAQAFLR